MISSEKKYIQTKKNQFISSWKLSQMKLSTCGELIFSLNQLNIINLLLNLLSYFLSKFHQNDFRLDDHIYASDFDILVGQ